MTELLVVANKRVVGSFEFALLDDSDPESMSFGCQKTPLSSPDVESGWVVASSTNPEHRIAVVSRLKESFFPV